MHTKYIIKYLGNIKLVDLKPYHIQDMIETMQKNEQDITNPTIKKTHGVLKRDLKHAVRLGMVSHNVAEMVDPPKNTTEKDFLPGIKSRLISFFSLPENRDTI